MKTNNYNTFSVSFNCYESKKRKDGMAPIELCVIENGNRHIIQLSRRERPAYFAKAIKARSWNDVKDYLEQIRRIVGNCQTQLLKENKEFSVESLKSFLRWGTLRQITVADVFDEYLGLLYARVGKDLTAKTYRKYQLARDKFYLVCDGEMSMKSVLNCTIEKFIVKLREQYENQTVMGYASKVKSVFIYALKNHYIDSNPFSGIPIRRWNREVQFLVDEELDRIRKCVLGNASLERVRDLFLFQTSCGLSYTDIEHLRREDICQDDSGMFYIQKPRIKTGVLYTAVILEEGVNILKKYDFQIPVVTNQKTNAYLKTIQDLACIDKPLHTHIARHTYATRCLNAGIRIEIVAKLLGHSSIVQTQHYAKLLRQSVLSEVREAFMKD